MKLTNKKNLPSSFVKALERDYHKGADYSASQLTKSPRMVHLENRHYDEMSEDVTDRIWALFGSANHNILQKGETENQIIEQYFKEEINGVKLSGMNDVYENEIIYDYKVTSIWSYIYISDKLDDFESQLNTYAWFFRKAGFKVKELKIIMIFRDWMSSKAKFDSNYPDCQVQVVDIKLWSNDKIESYLKERISLYESTKNLKDNDLPFCSEKERWVKPSQFAIMKEGRKTAIKLHSTNEDAEKHLETLDEKHYIEERKSEQFKRCAYCNAKEFCNQYKEVNGL